MAGAISAGAYTAGVMDYLFESLERWETAKQIWPDKVPQHNVVIDALTGASAGGMTAAIASAALQTKFAPVRSESMNDDTVTQQNKFYDAWINLNGDANMLISLLSNSDIKKDKLKSFINGEFIDQIANRLISVPEGSKFYNRPYIADKLEIWVSLSNLTGFPIKIEFNKDNERPDNYISYNHMDFAHFAVYKEQTESLLHEIAVNFKDPADMGKLILAQAAMATGAFPVGLPSRIVQRPRSFFINNTIYKNFLQFNINPDDLPAPDEKGFLKHLFVDGGTLNNEPFDVTEYILRKRIDLQNNEWQHTILMIDPFPSMESGKPSQPDTDAGLVSLFGKLANMLMQQPLVKTEDLESALSRSDYKRFLIAPRRDVPTDKGDQTKNGGAAIACGSLGGFGGFLAKGFRQHDFLLGRYNCQRFLQKHFSVKINDNNLVSRAYENKAIRDAFIVQPDKESTLLFVPIIPDVDPLTGEKMKSELLPEWPVDAPYKEKNLQLIEPILRNRINGMTGNYLSGLPFWLFKLLASKKLSGNVIEIIEKQLKRHHLTT